MSNSLERVLHTKGVVNDLFAIEGHLLSTRTADAYKSIDKNRSGPMMLWMLRHPLPKNSDAVRRFHSRMEAIQQMAPAVCEMQSFGVDAGGVAFAVFPAADGHSVLSGNMEVSEAERRFMKCVKLIARLHEESIVCGDLCGSSFWIDRAGEVKLFGVMGSFDSEAAATAMLPPVETLPFLAPEQRSGGGVAASTDVFALGVLGYNLITGYFPFGQGQNQFVSEFDLDKVKPIAAFVNTPPAWAETVLMKCINPDPAQRYKDAHELLIGINEARTRAATGERAPLVPTPNKNSSLVHRGTTQPELASKKPARAAEAEPQKSSMSTTRLFLLGLAFIGATCAVLFSGMLDRLNRNENEKLQNDLAVHRDGAASDQMRQAIEVIGESDNSLTEKQTQLEHLINSDDPLAHDALVKSARDASNERFRTMSEQAIIDRARRLGLLRSAEQVRQWLRTLRQGQLPSTYEATLESLDTTLPMEARASSLRQAYPENPILILRLAAALALDTNKLEEYQPLLAQLVGDAMKDDSANTRSTLALILSNPELAMVFGDDAIQRRDQIPNADVVWLLKALAERNDSSVRALANAAVERGILSPLRALYLATIRDRDDLDPEVIGSLIRAAAGALRIEDIASFGRWYDLQSEKVLLAVCADVTDKQLLLEAFDTVAGKSLTLEPAASLVAWVRAHHWDDRAKFAHAIGVMANLDYVEEREAKEAIATFDSGSKDPELLDILMKSNSPVVLKDLVERYPGKLGLTGLLEMLDSTNKSVRLAAIDALKGYNDIAVLKLVIDHYEKEKDPEVKQHYKEVFWVIRQREG